VAHLVHLEMELEKTEARLVELADIGDWKVTPILTAKKARLEHLIREAKESM